MTLTVRQQQVLDFLRNYQADEGVAPSTREIQEHFGFASQTAAMSHLRALERKGALRRSPRKARAVQISGALDASKMIEIPIYGRIAAGYAETAQQETEGTITVDRTMVRPSSQARSFALRVSGDSMIGAQIQDGDLVILEAREAKGNDIVAALLDGETTLKRLVSRDGSAFLRAENPAYPDLIPIEELTVQGVMVGLIRSVG